MDSRQDSTCGTQAQGRWWSARSRWQPSSKVGAVASRRRPAPPRQCHVHPPPQAQACASTAVPCPSPTSGAGLRLHGSAMSIPHLACQRRLQGRQQG
jgi:hypothetical protein